MTIAVQRIHICPPNGISHKYVVVIANTDRSRILVKHNKDGTLCFPRLECPEIPFYGHKVCECISQRFEKMCGTRYQLVLLYATINDHFKDHIRPVFSAFHCLSPNDNDTGMPVTPACNAYRWMATSEVDKHLDLIGETNCRWINDTKDFECFVFMMRDSEYKRHENEFGLRPWELPGWFKSTSNAASAILSKLGYEVQGEFEQFSVTHSTSAVLRADTNKGKVYLKASDGLEGRLTSLVAGFAPQLVREPIFVNEENEWMLMNDQGEHVTDDTRIEDFGKVLIQLGKLQLKSLDHIEALKDAGVEVRTSESVIRQMKLLLSDERVLEKLGTAGTFRTDNENGMPDIDVHSRALYELVHEFYDSGKCPLTLTHGDITENVLKSEDGSLVLFDWGSARIDIPLCDLICFEGSVTPDIEDEYLSLWEKYAPKSELRILRKISSIIGCVVYMFGAFDGEGWILEDWEIRALGRSLADAKLYAEKRNL